MLAVPTWTIVKHAGRIDDGTPAMLGGTEAVGVPAGSGITSRRTASRCNDSDTPRTAALRFTEPLRNRREIPRRRCGTRVVRINQIATRLASAVPTNHCLMMGAERNPGKGVEFQGRGKSSGLVLIIRECDGA
jgi:hypothetical protein